jgi:hypothetical protein
MWTVHVETLGVLVRKQVISLIHTGNFNNRKFANECISTLELTLFLFVMRRRIWIVSG